MSKWYAFARTDEKQITEELLRENPWVTVTRARALAREQAGATGYVYEVRALESGDTGEANGHRGWVDLQAAFVSWV